MGENDSEIIDDGPLCLIETKGGDFPNLYHAEVEEDEDKLGLAEIPATAQVVMKPITGKFFYKEMAKIKEKSRTTGTGIMPPKKSASAYIIFQKEVSEYELF